MFDLRWQRGWVAERININALSTMCFVLLNIRCLESDIILEVTVHLQVVPALAGSATKYYHHSNIGRHGYYSIQQIDWR